MNIQACIHAALAYFKNKGFKTIRPLKDPLRKNLLLLIFEDHLMEFFWGFQPDQEAGRMSNGMIKWGTCSKAQWSLRLQYPLKKSPVFE